MSSLEIAAIREEVNTKQEQRNPDDSFKDELEDAPPPSEHVSLHLEAMNFDSDEDLMSDSEFNLGLESNYDEVKAEILKKSKEEGKTYIYTDPDFPAEVDSLAFTSTKIQEYRKLEWKRPHHISREAPHLLQDNVATEDVLQGALGDCWWLSSCAAVCREPKYMKRLIPSDQSMLKDGGYVGMFHFHFWRFGNWVDVIVDDKLPADTGAQPAFGHCSENSEFWLPLMEKAYAKLHGSYEAISGGFAQDALEDLTGGIAVNYSLGSKTPKDLYKKLLKASRNKSFVCAGTEGSAEQADKKTGLVSRHAYTVTKATKIVHKNNHVNLLKIRNPWGNEVEWKGEWSDSSAIWDDIDEATKNQIGYAYKDNGEWFMSFDDFKHYFSEVTICTIGPDFDADGVATGDKWHLKIRQGKWIKHKSAGGCRNDLDTFATNPQYYLHFAQPDAFDPANDDQETQGKCSVIIGLMQEYRRAEKSKGPKNNHIGITVYKVKEKPTKKIETSFMKYNYDYASSGKFTNRREVSISDEFEPGHYVIIPSTFYPNKPGSFLVRVYTEQSIEVYELE